MRIRSNDFDLLYKDLGEVVTKQLAAEAMVHPKITMELLVEQIRLESSMGMREGWTSNTYEYDFVNWALRDRFIIARGGELENTHRMFSEPIGHRKNMNETNMMYSFKLPVPQKFRLQRFMFVFDPDNDIEDNQKWRRVAWWQFFIGQKVYAECSFMPTSTSGRMEDMHYHNGYPNGLVPADTLQLDKELGLFFDYHETFCMQLCTDRVFKPSKYFAFDCMLDGVLARGIQ